MGNIARKIRVVYEDKTEEIFPSKHSTMRHFNIQNNELDAYLKRARPCAWGKRVGITFFYADEEK